MSQPGLLERADCDECVGTGQCMRCVMVFGDDCDACDKTGLCFKCGGAGVKEDEEMTKLSVTIEVAI